MQRIRKWKNILIGTVGVLLVGCASANNQSDPGPESTTTLDSISFGVGPYFPTPNENRQQFEPFFDALAAELDLPEMSPLPKIGLAFLKRYVLAP